MKRSELKIGMLCILDGDIVEITEFENGGVVVESQENGEEFTTAAKLQPIG